MTSIECFENVSRHVFTDVRGDEIRFQEEALEEYLHSVCLCVVLSKEDCLILMITCN